MMEKYGSDRSETYNVVEIANGATTAITKVHGSNLSFDEAVKLKEQFPQAEIQKN